MSLSPKSEEFQNFLEAFRFQYGVNALVGELNTYIYDHGIKNVLLKDTEMEIEKEKHITEQKYPEQTKRFRELLEEEYQTHLRKNADYSAMNILGTGLIGIGVRFWDKTARIMNLLGFNIQTGEFTGVKANLVEDESIIDSFGDAGVYAKIAKIYSEGKWGK